MGGREHGRRKWKEEGREGGREGGREDVPVAVVVSTRTLEEDVVEVREGGLELQGLRSKGRVR